MSRWPIRSARAFPALVADAGRGGRRAGDARRHLSRDGGAAILDPRRKPSSTARWGCDVIGMTAMPEAKLAREAELPYASVGMVTDYDCWREGEEAVEVATIIARLHANAGTARRLVEALARALPKERAPSPIDTELDTRAASPRPDARDPAMLAKLDAICRRVLAR